MKNALPDHIVIIAYFETYTSRGKRRDVPNNVRKYLMGKYQSDEKGLPEKINETYGYEVILPFSFSLIKRPIQVKAHENEKGRLVNVALGAVGIYRYLGSVDKIEEIVNRILKECSERFKNKYMGIKEFSILTASKVFP